MSYYNVDLASCYGTGEVQTTTPNRKDHKTTQAWTTGLEDSLCHYNGCLWLPQGGEFLYIYPQTRGVLKWLELHQCMESGVTKET